MIISIKDLFAKYAKLEPRNKRTKEAFLQAVTTCTNHTLVPSDISIQNTAVFVASHPLIKKEILQLKQEILIETERILSKKTITTIQ